MQKHPLGIPQIRRLETIIEKAFELKEIRFLETPDLEITMSELHAYAAVMVAFPYFAGCKLRLISA